MALTAAQMSLARREYREAQGRAEALLQDARVPRDVRAGAALVAADAAYATGSYKHALVRYNDSLTLLPTGPDAMHAALQLGWTQLRDGQRDGAVLSWMEAADRFANDPRAPLALLLAASVRMNAGETAAADTLLERIIAKYPSSVHAGAARLTRSITAVREHRDEVAVRELDQILRGPGTAAIDDRRRVMEALARPGREVTLETPAPPRGVATARPAARNPVRESDDQLGRFATAFVQSGDRDGAPYVLHALSLVGAGERGWADASVASLVQQLVDGWPSYPAAPALLARVAAAASSGGQSPVARHAYETLIARYPGTAVASTARVDLAEALVRAGDRAAARKQLKEAIAARGDATPRALLLLAQVEEQLGNRREALAAYDRVLTDYPRLERSATSVLAHARLMEATGQPERARALLQRIVDASTGDVAAEASYRIGRILSAQGQHAAAVDWFMTAAYAADRSKWTQPSLLGAVRCFTALDRPQEALVAYRKLTATPVVAAGQSDVTPAASASPAMAERREDGTETMGDTALRLADALQRTGDRDGALEVYLSAAHLRGGPAAQRAFVGAVRNLVASGDRVFAETLYRRLAESGDADPALLAEARKALGSK